MSEKKHIDRLFQEKFKDFEVAPNDAVWNRIQQDLPKKKRRKPLVIWWQLGGVAAVILLLLTIGVSVFGPDTDSQINKESPIVNEDSNNTEPIGSDRQNNSNSINTKTVIVDAQNSSNAKTRSKVGSSYEEKDNEEEALLTSNANMVNSSQRPSKNDNKSAIAEKSKSNAGDNSTMTDKTAKKLEVLIPEIKIDENEAVAENTRETQNANAEVQQDTNDSTPDDHATSIEEAIAAQEELTNEKEKENKNRWSISPNVAPVYFSSIGQGSPVNEQFNENTKGSDVSMSYGISGSYAFTNRLKVRIGVNSVNLNQTTADVFAFNAVDGNTASRPANMDNVVYTQSSNSYVIMSSAVMNRVSSPELFNSKISGELEQRFGFIEVPLELEYRLIDKKFGFNLIGGFSTFFLNNNELYADIDGASTLIGQANNINTTSFSANLGLGMDYSLSKQWNINLEPMFKYQINTFNNTSGEFRPFFIGVYSGLSFKF